MKTLTKMEQKHEFAFYVPYLSSFVSSVEVGEELVLTDEALYHRMVHVVRLQPSQKCIFFDQNIHIYFIINLYRGKKHIQGIIYAKQVNSTLKPHITFFLPILKKSDFDGALYALAEVGVNKIQLVETQKSQRLWNQREYEHAQHIIISAAEQSKNFSFPLLEPPISIESASIKNSSVKIFFDPKGGSFFEFIQKIYAQPQQSITLFIGPEGDLTNEEKTLIEKNDFIFCALTPTILKSTHAAALGAGFTRSVFNC